MKIKFLAMAAVAILATSCGGKSEGEAATDSTAVDGIEETVEATELIAEPEDPTAVADTIAATSDQVNDALEAAKQQVNDAVEAAKQQVNDKVSEKAAAAVKDAQDKAAAAVKDAQDKAAAALKNAGL